jgi:glycosyltransferase involved in cell wall biosynthesis
MKSLWFMGITPTATCSRGITVEDREGIRFCRVPLFPTPSFAPFLKTVLPASSLAIKQLESFLVSENFDVAHLHGYGLFFIGQLSKTIKKLGKSYMLTLHGAPVSPEKVGGIVKVAYSFYCRFYGKPLLAAAAKITAVSRFTTTFPEFASYVDVIRVIPNGLDANLYADIEKTAPVASKLLRIVSFGRLEWLKGFQYFLKILVLIKESGFAVSYTIYGHDNGMGSELEAEVVSLGLAGDVVLGGFAEIETKLAALAVNDIVAVPSLVENYPAVVLEALCAKRFCVANRAGGIPEIIEDGVNGLLINVENAEESAKKLVEFFEDESAQKSILANLAHSEKYDWKRIIKKYDEILKKL